MLGGIRSIVAVLFGVALIALAPRAEARPRPTVATDAFYVGTRLVPGAALLAAWDLDVYLSRDRAISLGPGVSIAVLGSDASRGTEQELLLAVDVARLKIGLNEAGGAFRPYVMIGGGFSYVRLRDHVDHDVVIISAPDETTTGDRRFQEADEFVPMLTLGGGGDLFIDGPWALSVGAVSHFRLSAFDRMPELWTELLAGIRFGL